MDKVCMDTWINMDKIWINMDKIWINMDKICKGFPPRLDLFKALSSCNSVRNNVYHAQRIVVKCTVQIDIFFGNGQLRCPIPAD